MGISKQEQITKARTVQVCKDEIWQNDMKTRQTCILTQTLHIIITYTVGSSVS